MEALIKKVEALQKSKKITNLKSLQSFLGACNFYRRHVKNFTFSSAILTELTKKNVPWNWTEEHERAFLELKSKLANVSGLGVPNIEGEIVLVTDASNIGGGGSLFQWQPPASGATLGVQKDGSLKHTFGEKTKLVPLGHFNWKWSPTRCNYPTYEQELLIGILIISSQCRNLGHLPILWLCDQEATSSFARGPPPNKPRLKRWWLMLTQFRLNIFHLPGIKNELCDYISRNNFDEKFQVEIEELAKKAFQHMDVQLDLRLEEVF